MSNIDDEVRELQQRVAKLERQLAFVLQQQDLVYQETPDESVMYQVQELLHQGRKIRAIKVYREATGVGLKQAKAFIESLE